MDDSKIIELYIERDKWFSLHAKRRCQKRIYSQILFFDSIKEISVEFSFSESKVKNMLFYTRNKLKDYNNLIL